MARKIGYFLEGMANGYDEIIVEKMKAFGCDQILRESACDALRCIVWEQLKRIMREGDYLVFPSLLHAVDGGLRFRDLRRLCDTKNVTILVFEGYRPQDSIAEFKGTHAMDMSFELQMVHRIRQLIVLGRMRELCKRQFPGVKPKVLKHILISRILQIDMPENEMAYFTDYVYTQEYKRVREWLKGDYKKDLQGRDRAVFENEFYGDKKHSSSWWTCV